MSLQFDINWHDDAPGVQGADAAVWGEIGVLVHGTPLEAVDLRDRTMRPRFATSLLALAEWLIDAWPCLTEERAAPPTDHRAARTWASQHDLRFGRGGGPMPSVTVHRLDRERVRLSVRDDQERPPGISLSFYRRLEVVGSATEVIRELARVVELVIDRIGAVDRWLADDYAARWSQTRTPRALGAGRLGVSGHRLDSLDDIEARALDQLLAEEHLLAIAESLGTMTLTERLARAAPIVASLPPSAELAPESAAWHSLRLATRAATPWSTGWRAASQFRDAAGWSAQSPPGSTLTTLLEERFDWPSDKQFTALPVPTHGLDMITMTMNGRMPRLLTARASDRARRFRLAKAIYFALDAAERTELVVDSSRMPHHSEANAFAAELLAPRAFLMQHAPPDGMWEPEDVDQLATTCAVDPRVVTHQIQNRGLGQR